MGHIPSSMKKGLGLQGEYVHHDTWNVPRNTIEASTKYFTRLLAYRCQLEQTGILTGDAASCRPRPRRYVSSPSASVDPPCLPPTMPTIYHVRLTYHNHAGSAVPKDNGRPLPPALASLLPSLARRAQPQETLTAAIYPLGTYTWIISTLTYVTLP